MDGTPDLTRGGGVASKILHLSSWAPKEKMAVSQKQWAKRSVLVWSLSQWVLSEWVVKELKLRGIWINSDPKVFALDEDHHLIRFLMEDCEGILKGGPWFSDGGPWVVQELKFQTSSRGLMWYDVWWFGYDCPAMGMTVRIADGVLGAKSNDGDCDGGWELGGDG